MNAPSLPTQPKKPLRFTADMLGALPRKPADAKAAAPATTRTTAAPARRLPCVSPTIAQLVQMLAAAAVLGGTLVLLGLIVGARTPSLLAILGILAATAAAAILLTALSSLLGWTYTIMLLLRDRG